MRHQVRADLRATTAGSLHRIHGPTERQRFDPILGYFQQEAVVAIIGLCEWENADDLSWDSGRRHIGRRLSGSTIFSALTVAYTAEVGISRHYFRARR